jgi:prepilin-type N-terminal cleavage/methylation domain-containing protein/prepilin-type processing-associated H-X9-DG protein
MMMKRRFSNGFTIVELLVVIAIIAMLVGLLLPAVNRARATARQTQCINNQKQLGTAVQTYFTSKGRMPDYMSPGRKVESPSAEPFGWVHPLLPNMGQMNVYDLILEHAIGPKQNVTIANFIADQRLYIDLLVCPSDPPINTEQAAVSYAPNAGRDPTERPSGVSPNLPVDWPENGAFGRNWPTNPGNPNQQPTKNSIEQITRGDGTTRTMLLSENVRLTTWNDTSNHLFQAIMWSLKSTGKEEPTGPPLTYAPPIDEEITFKSGNALLATPSSKHTGGFIAVYCDGHVDYINNQISYSVLARLMSSNGALVRLPGMEVRDLEVDAQGNPIPVPFWQKTPISDADLL